VALAATPVAGATTPQTNTTHVALAADPDGTTALEHVALATTPDVDDDDEDDDDGGMGLCPRGEMEPMYAPKKDCEMEMWTPGTAPPAIPPIATGAGAGRKRRLIAQDEKQAWLELGARRRPQDAPHRHDAVVRLELLGPMRGVDARC
jgi:hypothetical protein